MHLYIINNQSYDLSLNLSQIIESKEYDNNNINIRMNEEMNGRINGLLEESM